jgi:hypothetical protein
MALGATGLVSMILWTRGCVGAAGQEDERRRAAAIESERVAAERQREVDQKRAREAEEERRLSQETRERKERELTRLRGIGAAGRAAAMQDCVQNARCPEPNDSALILEAAQSQSERRQLIALQDRLNARRAALAVTTPREPGVGPRSTGQRGSPASGSESSGGSGRVKCCDGTLSPSCSCGRSLRGCCSHHGGVCGCD